MRSSIATHFFQIPQIYSNRWNPISLRYSSHVNRGNNLWCSEIHGTVHFLPAEAVGLREIPSSTTTPWTAPLTSSLTGSMPHPFHNDHSQSQGKETNLVTSHDDHFGACWGNLVLWYGAFKKTTNSKKIGQWSSGRKVGALERCPSFRHIIPSWMTVQTFSPSWRERTDVGSRRFLSSQFPVVLNEAIYIAFILLYICYFNEEKMQTWGCMTTLLLLSDPMTTW